MVDIYWLEQVYLKITYGYKISFLYRTGQVKVGRVEKVTREEESESEECGINSNDRNVKFDEFKLRIIQA